MSLNDDVKKILIVFINILKIGPTQRSERIIVQDLTVSFSSTSGWIEMCVYTHTQIHIDKEIN